MHLNCFLSRTNVCGISSFGCAIYSLVVSHSKVCVSWRMDNIAKLVSSANDGTGEMKLGWRDGRDGNGYTCVAVLEFSGSPVAQDYQKSIRATEI